MLREQVLFSDTEIISYAISYWKHKGGANELMIQINENITKITAQIL